jgi:hypothetical protein
MSKVAAVYVVYEDSGYLTESVRRAYYCVDKILFLLNFNPWNGTPNNSGLVETYKTVLNMYDPLKKIEIISASWVTEEEQRNFGLRHLRKNEIDWCFIIDDDEMYNFHDLKNQITRVKNDSNSVYLSPHQVYWKTRNWAIGNLVEALPSFAKTDGSVYFTKARAVMVERGNSWHTFLSSELICHHLSYVRSDDKMLRKIRTFSHADDIKDVWYDKVWMKWTPDMEKIHPNQDNPGSFSKAVDAQTLSRKLEPLKIGSGSVLETFLYESRSVKKPDLNWLKMKEFSQLVEPLYQLIYLLLQEKEGLFLEIGTTRGAFYFTVCEAILQSQRKSQARSVPVNSLPSTNKTYESFSQSIDFSQIKPNSVDWLHLAEGDFSISEYAEVVKSLKEGGFLFITGTLTSKKEVFEKYRKGKNYYEYKLGDGIGVIEW